MYKSLGAQRRANLIASQIRLSSLSLSLSLSLLFLPIFLSSLSPLSLFLSLLSLSLSLSQISGLSSVIIYQQLECVLRMEMMLPEKKFTAFHYTQFRAWFRRRGFAFVLKAKAMCTPRRSMVSHVQERERRDYAGEREGERRD